MSRLFFLFFISCWVQLSIAQTKIDSLLNQLNRQDLPDSIQAKIWYDLGVATRRTNRDTAMIFAHQGLVFSYQKDLKKSMADFHLLKSILFYETNYLDSIRYHAQKSVNIASEIGYTRNHLRSLNMLGLAEDLEGNYSEALKYYMEAIDEASPDDNFDLLASLNYNIGLVYDAQGLKKESMEYFMRALRINETKVHDEYSKLRYLNGIAPTFAELGLHDSADLYYKKALDLAFSLEDNYTLASLYQGIGSTALDRGDLEKAFDSYKKSEAISLKNNDLFMLSYNYQGLSAYYDHLESRTGKKEHLRRSVEYGKKLLEVAKKLGSRDRILEGYNRIYDASNELGDYETALKYHIKYTDLKDSIFNERNSNQILALKERYEADQREQQLAIQEEQLRRNEVQLAKEATVRQALVGGVFLVLVITGLIYRNQRLKSKALHEKEALLKEIHHRVKNNLQVISSLLNMQSRGTTDEGMKEAIKEGQARVKAMSLIHQKLYQNENIAEIDFEDYCRQLFQQLDTVYKKSGNVSCELDVKDIKLDIDTAVPLGLILNELISNAYKYAFEGLDHGKLKISLNRTDEKHLQLEVADNGKGLPDDFTIENAESLGLKLVHMLTKQLKGTLRIEKQEGTRFMIRFTELNPKLA